MTHLSLLTLIVFSLSAVSCSKEYIKKVLKDNPEILAEVIEDNPKAIIEALSKASEKLRKEEIIAAQKKRQEDREEAFKNPKKPEISSNRVFFGNPKAPITIVEYSDFQCPFCKRAADVVDEVLKEYKDKVRVVYKHLPLNFHPQAEIASKYYEAVAKVDKSKAKAFHDGIFAKQSELSKGEAFLDALVKQVGLNAVDVKKHLDSVQSVVDKDKAEASKFGFQGTPGFLVGGVPLNGAQPLAEFKNIIDRHLAEMK